MLFVKSFHIIAMTAWFAGLFYLPRLFVYHVTTEDAIGYKRFVLMERRLYYGIMWPSAILTTSLGLWLLLYSPQYYLHAGWMQIKLGLVLIVWAYHLACAHYLKLFAQGNNHNHALFYRLFNEVPTLLLVSIVVLVVVKPF